MGKQLAWCPQVSGAVIELIGHPKTYPGVKRYLAKVIHYGKENKHITAKMASKVGKIYSAVIDSTKNAWWIEE